MPMRIVLRYLRVDVLLADVRAGALHQTGARRRAARERLGDGLGRQAVEEGVGAAGLVHPVCLAPLFLGQVVALARLAAGNGLQQGDRLYGVVDHLLYQYGVRIVAGHAEAIRAGPFCSGLADPHADIAARQQVEVRGSAVHRRRKARDLVAAADDTIARLAEPRGARARILSAGIAIAERCALAACYIIAVIRSGGICGPSDLTHCSLPGSVACCQFPLNGSPRPRPRLVAHSQACLSGGAGPPVHAAWRDVPFRRQHPIAAASDGRPVSSPFALPEARRNKNSGGIGARRTAQAANPTQYIVQQLSDAILNDYSLPVFSAAQM